MTTFLDEALSQITTTGVARANRWIIRMQLPLGTQGNTLFAAQIDERIAASTQRIDISCEQVSIPGKSFEMGESRTHNFSIKRPHRTVMEDITATFRCSGDMFERKYFEAWMGVVQDQTTRDYDYSNNYSSDIDIYQLSNDLSEVVYGIRLQGAFPIALTALEGDQSTTNDYFKQAVTFTYNQWKPINIRDDLYTTNKAGGLSLFEPINILSNILSF